MSDFDLSARYRQDQLCCAVFFYVVIIDSRPMKVQIHLSSLWEGDNPT